MHPPPNMDSTPNHPPMPTNNEDGLKFGQKIYFEDHAVVPPVPGFGSKTLKSDHIPSSSSSSSNSSKKSGTHNGQPPRCQVEGCKIDLSEAKTYYSRHKVCTFHSKSPMVVVSGIQQRFCQQCSRFHQLLEFDQGKRSCRRRLAGHNERRRKPPPGSLLSSRLGRLSSSLFGCNTAGNGGFMLDFSSYSRRSEKDPWPDMKPHERVTGSHSTSSGKYLHNMWPGNSEEPPEMFLQGSIGISNYPIPPGEYNTVTGGVSTDSSCALSLLSNQTWGSKTRSSGMELNNLMNLDGAPCTEAHTVTVANVPSTTSSSPWGYKTHESNAELQMMLPNHLGLTQISGTQTHSGLVPGDLLMDQVHDGHVHWSLS